MLTLMNTWSTQACCGTVRTAGLEMGGIQGEAAPSYIFLFSPTGFAPSSEANTCRAFEELIVTMSVATQSLE